MPMPQLPRTRRLSRPSAPSCRGGASSLLRLAQPAARADGASAVQRAAAMLALWPAAGADASFITPLQPSRPMGLR